MKNYNTVLITLFGLINSLGIVITGSSINYWFAEEGINIKIIGILSLLTIPYSINFLWTPIIDKYHIPYLSIKYGQKFSWLLSFILCMIISTYICSELNPNTNMIALLSIITIISICSSTIDSLLNTWRVSLSKTSIGKNTGAYIISYRAGTILFAGGGIYISTIIGWSITYKIYSALLLMLILILTYKKLKTIQYKCPPENIQNIIPLLFNQQNIQYTVLNYVLLTLYNLPDHMFLTVINPFVIELGFQGKEIAIIGKFFGTIGAILGTMIGGRIIDITDKKSSLNALCIFGFIHTLSQLLFIILVYTGKNIYIYMIVVGIHSITGGMSMVSCITYITTICNKNSTTEYAFYASTMGVARILSAISGYLVSILGWTLFFTITPCSIIPAILIAIYLLYNKKPSI